MRPYHTIVLGSLFVVLTSCGGTTAVLFSGLSDNGSSGGNSSSPAILSIESIDARSSPASLRFTLTDTDSTPVDVQLRFSSPADPSPKDLVLVPNVDEGITTNLIGLSSSPQGVTHTRLWDFVREDQLGTDALTREVQISLMGIDGGVAIEARVETLDVGNDPPVLTITSEPNRSITGVIPIEFNVFDSQNDSVSIDVFYDVLDDDPDLGFLPARGGTSPGPNGQPMEFLWNTLSDLGFSDHRVELKLIPNDGPGEGFKTGAAAIDLVQVDNNTEPRVTIDHGALLVNPDRRSGIPIPYTVFDGNAETGEPGDEAVVIFQWKRTEQTDFPELPSIHNADQARTFLNSSELVDQRRALQVCTEIPRRFSGRTVQLDESKIRLPELSAIAAGALDRHPTSGEIRLRGILEILQVSSIPNRVRVNWTEDPGLESPVAALPVGSGPHALVLEQTDATWRLRSLNVTTGGETRLIAQGSSVPTAMAYEAGNTTLLVATFLDPTDSWEIRRIHLNSGIGGPGERLIGSMDGSPETGRVRGIASLGANSALATIGSSLLKLAYQPGRDPIASTLLGPPNTPLAEPWGIVLDPVVPNRVYVAERSRGRILSIGVNQLESTIAVLARGIDLPHPTSIALERFGARMLVITDSNLDDGTQELRAIELRNPVDQDGDGSADIEAYEVANGYRVNSTIATGTDKFRLIALSGDSDLAIAGGVLLDEEVDGTDINFDPLTQTVQFQSPTPPTTQTGDKWRITALSQITASPEGSNGLFLWSSQDVRSGQVQLRALAFDGERGIGDEPLTSKGIRHPLDTPPKLLTTTDSPLSILATDLDQDGDEDLVLGSDGPTQDNLKIFFQSAPGIFSSSPITLTDPAIDFPTSLAASDFDRDGDIDIVSANLNSSTLTVFFQSSPGEFDKQPLVLGDPNETADPLSVVAADIDQDGATDIITTSNRLFRDNVRIFYQTLPGEFALDPVPISMSTFSNSIRSIRAADLDQDGDLDILSANDGPGFLAIFFQESPRAFESPPLLIRPSQTDTPMDVTPADLDQDGDLDIISANRGRENLTIYFQTSPGIFSPAPTILRDPIASEPSNVAVGDFDRDGDLDVLSSNEGSGNLTLFSQVSPGCFEPKPSVVGGNSSTRLLGAFDLSDLDGNGILDIVATTPDGVAIFEYTSPGIFDGSVSVLQDLSSTTKPFAVAVGDIDLNGLVDIAATHEGSNSLTLFRQISPGLFEDTPTIFGTGPQTFSPRALALADLDSDGDLDLVCTSNRGGSSTVAIFRQTLPGTLSPDPDTIGQGVLTDPLALVPRDIDGDTRLDLVIANTGRDSISIFYQDESGGFGSSATVGSGSTTPAPTAVAVVDIDGDSDLDLVTANGAGNNLQIFTQTTPRKFEPFGSALGSSSTTEAPRSVVAVDLNLDGHVDIACASASRDHLVIFFQNADGTFSESPTVLGDSSSTDGPQSIVTADMDLDGDLDLVVASSDSSSLSIFLQVSPGIFDPLPKIIQSTLATNPRSLVASDIDQDGDIDLVSANQGSDNLTIFMSVD